MKINYLFGQIIWTEKIIKIISNVFLLLLRNTMSGQDENWTNLSLF